MRFRTVKNIPTLNNYYHASMCWERAKPIRGRSNDLRPLAERRYADTYSIRKNSGNDAVECVLYKTPVVTFMPNGEVHVRNSGYATASTHMFIQEVLGTGISARGQRGRSIISVHGAVFSLGANEVLRLGEDSNRKWMILNEQTHYDYRLNRKATNNVRGRYKDFYDYMKGFIKLRAQDHQGAFYGEPTLMIECTFAEIGDCLGTSEGWNNSYTQANTMYWNTLTEKPGTPSRDRRMVRLDTYSRIMKEFLDLIASDQPENDRHMNFHKAMMILLTYATAITEKKTDVPIRTLWLNPLRATTTLETTLFKWFADEVLERYEVPKGKVPSNKYTSWIEGRNA